MCDQVFGFGKYGGYGTIINILSRYLKKKGVECSVITWRNPGQREVEILDGVEVHSYPYDPTDNVVAHLLSYVASIPLYKRVDADVFHHVDARVETYLARKLVSERGHIIHFQDPYDENDFRLMSTVDHTYRYDGLANLKLWLNYSFVRGACKPPARLYTHARYLVPKIRRLFRTTSEVRFLPNPVELPSRRIRKASEPTVCFLGRWDPQKRVDLFLKLASNFPNVRFVAMGRGRNTETERSLTRRFSSQKNVELLGLVPNDMKSKILEKSWILVNTSIREAFPISLLEACAHKTAILSRVNPDGFSSRFGVHVRDDRFSAGLEELLRDDLWREKGARGYEYVREIHDISRLVNVYYEIYRLMSEM